MHIEALLVSSSAIQPFFFFFFPSQETKSPLGQNNLLKWKKDSICFEYEHDFDSLVEYCC